MKHFLAVQTYGWVNNNPIDSGSNGTKARIKYAVNLIRLGIIPRENLTAIFPQGYSKKNPRQDNGNESLGQNASRYLLEISTGLNISLINEPLTWGTDKDVEETMFQIGLYTSDSKDMIGCVHFVSDPCHIQRVMICACANCSFDTRLVFHSATSHRLPNFQRFVREPVARLYARFIFRGRARFT
jgi:hypothetical protein